MRSFDLLLVWHRGVAVFSIVRVYDICLQFISIDVDRRPRILLIVIR